MAIEGKSLVRRVFDLEDEIKHLKSQLQAYVKMPPKYKKPHSTHGEQQADKYGYAGNKKDDLEGPLLPFNEKDLADSNDEPSVPFNEHSHGRYSGGALDINTFELVEYDWEQASDLEPENAGNWDRRPPVKHKVYRPEFGIPKFVLKRGKMDVTFNPKTEKWEIKSGTVDIKNTMFVAYDEEGNIMKDENGNEMKAPLWNSDPYKSSIIWDKDAKTWRLFAVYADAPTPEEEEE